MRETTRNGETATYEILDGKPPESIKLRIATPNLPLFRYMDLFTSTYWWGNHCADHGKWRGLQSCFPLRLEVYSRAHRHNRCLLAALGKAVAQEVRITD